MRAANQPSFTNLRYGDARLHSEHDRPRGQVEPLHPTHVGPHRDEVVVGELHRNGERER